MKKCEDCKFYECGSATWKGHKLFENCTHESSGSYGIYEMRSKNLEVHIEHQHGGEIIFTGIGPCGPEGVLWEKQGTIDAEKERS
jgi:hypothetical protein